METLKDKQYVFLSGKNIFHGYVCTVEFHFCVDRYITQEKITDIFKALRLPHRVGDPGAPGRVGDGAGAGGKH